MNDGPSKVNNTIGGTVDSQDDKYSTLKYNISNLVEKLMKRHKVTGLSIALVEGNNIAWVKGFGYSDKEEGNSSSPNTIYKIGSITKLFTATAIMQLVDKGLLDIDKPLQHYLPEFSIKSRFDNIEQITIRSLMTHHSGIPSGKYGGAFSKSIEEEPESFRTILGYLKDQYLAYPPNYIFSYSNLAADILGILVERVSGVEYERYIENNILMPLGMNNTTFSFEKALTMGLSKAYSKGKGKYENHSREVPAGGIYSNVTDMARFISWVTGSDTLSGSHILDENTLKQMLTVQNDSIKLDFDMKVGLNWMLARPSLDYAGKVCWHDGGSLHYFSILTVLPEHGLGVIVLSNSEKGGYAVGEIADQILKEALKIKNVIEPTKSIKALTEAENCIIKEAERKIDFATVFGLVSVETTGKKQTLKMKGNLFDLIPSRDGWYSLKLRLFGIVPVKLKQIANLRVSVQEINGERIFAIEQILGDNSIKVAFGKEYTKKPIPEIWMKRAGKYRILHNDNETIKAVELNYYNGVLYVKCNVRLAGVLKLIVDPISDTEGIIAGLGRGAGETVRFRISDGKEVLELSGLELAKM